MNFATLLTEFVARGAQDNDTRNGIWLNEAYQFILNNRGWPFTVAEATGTADAGEVVVTAARKIILVSDISSGASPGARLQRASLDTLSNEFAVEDITESGDPVFWWLDETETTPTIKAYPVGGTIFARYYKRLDNLTGTDTPVFDEAYHELILDLAMVRVYKDNDDFETAGIARQDAMQSLGQMGQDYQWFAKEPEYIQVMSVTDG